MLGVISVIIALVGLVAGFVLIKKRHQKPEAKGEGDVDNTDTGITLDKVYNDLLNFESDSETCNDNDTVKATVPAVLKLKDRTFWSIYKRVVISWIIILSFAATIATISVMGQKAYNERKLSEEAIRIEELAIEKEATIERQEAEDRRIIDLSKQLDSIDLHIKQIKTTSKKANNKKSGK